MAEYALVDQPWSAGNPAERSDLIRRYQLLGYREVTRLAEVMEAVVPIHGTGNFPTLDIKPSIFVQVQYLIMQNLLE